MNSPASEDAGYNNYLLKPRRCAASPYVFVFFAPTYLEWGPHENYGSKLA
jgi:hypothetical protein